MRKHFSTILLVTAIISAQDNKEQSKSQIVEAPVGNANLEWKDTVVN
jgi:hypothetical protein